MKYDIEQLLEAGEIIQIYPEGYSMYPMFVPGRDAAVIKKADVKKIRRADVVLYRSCLLYTSPSPRDCS